jgi:agmatine deiminase
MAAVLARYGLFAPASAHTLALELADVDADVDTAGLGQPTPHDSTPVTLPAQWQRISRVVLAWPLYYPPLWPLYDTLVRAIAPAAAVEIAVPNALWARAAALYMTWRGSPYAQRVRFLCLPTDDVWIRDYGPLVGRAADGEPVLVDPRFDPLPNYPQGRDDAFNRAYAAHYNMRYQPLPLHFEGGNLWSDGVGTLLISEQVFASNPYLTRERLLALLHKTFRLQKVIITPRLPLEETGHIDLLLKLVDETTIFLSAPAATTSHAVRRAARLLQRTTNARSRPYEVALLPTPPLYMNWGVYPVRRSYTNALTVNGHVLVPTYGLPTDDAALRLYEQALPGWRIVPIDSSLCIHGGGAVHCLTRDIL